MVNGLDQLRLQAVLQTAVDGVILIDATGTVLMFNPACERLFGYGAQEVIGQNVRMLMPEPFRSEHDRYLANYRNTGVARVIGIGREVVGRCKDGSTFPMHLSVGEATQDGVSFFVGIVHDLTERMEAEQALRESEERLRAVVSTAVDGVILIDSRGRIRMFNPACERLFGYDAGEVMGCNVRMLMPDPFRSEHDQYIANYLKTGEARIIGKGREVQGLRKDGSIFPMDLSVGEARQEGESVFVGIIHDLTERKRTEEQLLQAQKMEAVGQLSGGIAHDFNNLLTVIVGNVDMLRQQLQSRPDLLKLVDAVAAAGLRGAELTQRLLAFSRRQTLVPEAVDCNRLVESMRELLRRTLRQDIEISASLDPDSWRVSADAAQLESALLNLAVNAQDAMPDGGRLNVTSANLALDVQDETLHPDVQPGHYVIISVSDTGRGMSPEDKDRAFEPFFTTKEVGKGSGLGLSMVYGFVKQSNGHVTIESELGVGTTVRLYLPATAEGRPTETVAAQARGGDAPRGREKVLVAEDDPFVRAYAVACLEGMGYLVVAAVDGRDALARLQADAADADLLFTDIVMPGGMNGWELAERALAMKPELKVLFTSGYALDTLASRQELDPGVPVLNKPYRKAELAMRLREVLDG